MTRWVIIVADIIFPIVGLALMVLMVLWQLRNPESSRRPWTEKYEEGDAAA